MRTNLPMIAIVCLFIANGCDQIICTSRALQHLGGGYYYENVECISPIIYDAENRNSTVIGEVVVEFAFDSTFIIVCQHPYDDSTIVNRHEMTYKQRKEAFAKSTYRLYWIINKLDSRNWIVNHSHLDLSHYSNVYGPYTKEEFNRRCRELGVPDSLKLRPATPRDE
jgi:hypothetical protein